MVAIDASHRGDQDCVGALRDRGHHRRLARVDELAAAADQRGDDARAAADAHELDGESLLVEISRLLGDHRHRPTSRRRGIEKIDALLGTSGRDDEGAGAKKEGRVVFYTSLTLQEIDQVAAPFMKKYPFVKVDPFRGNSEQLLQKIAIEARAGRPQHDVAQFDAFEEWQLQKLGLLENYKSPEAKNYPAAYKDADGAWTAMYLNYIVLGYNPKMV